MHRLTLAFVSVLALTLGFAMTASAQDVDCPELTFEEAQDILAQDPNDPNRLDADNDGIACEANERGGTTGGGTTGGGTTRGTTTVPSTGAGVTAGQESSSLVLALLVASGVFGLAAMRARRA
ncbi:MAG: excalibur calcium-binding domain-containing protein [Chloroflexota bacterium]|nr:excalibur calcium-binding domain-containing protein [Chloroflexota bacterium]